MTLPKRAVISITTYNGVFYEDNKKTGLYWSEALHPYNVFREAGFEVDVTSETGKFGYDEHSIVGDALDPESKEAWEDPKHPLKGQLENKMLVASQVDPSKYGIFFAAGGHGSIYDYPKATGLHKLAAQIYDNGGVVAAVCHGPAVLPGIKDVKTSEPIIKGKKVTGFSEEGEKQGGVLDQMNKEGVQTIEKQVNAVGAKYIEPPTPFGDFTQNDGRIATGVNPASAKSTAENAVKIYKSL
ncbi:hypothetical protein WJX73_005418 [Symbiochloris irregularis]|uniref:D-lactate dehydratase n=1 Tax=Symbiochloris irregularis TaxID=706552 RepID=A0AAW1P7N0_9CHLO